MTRPGREGVRVACLLVLLVGLACLRPAYADGRKGSPSPAVEYWTIEPNEGQSAGGHAAIRIGEIVYHLEHRGDGLIADRRDPRQTFERRYRLRGNRSIDVLELDLPLAVERALAAGLESRYFGRQQRLRALEGVEAEADWLEHVAEARHVSIQVPGLGLLARGPSRCPEPTQGVTVVARASLVARLRSGALSRQLIRARQERDESLESLLEGRLPSSSLTPRAEQDLEPGGVVRRLVEALQLEAALEAIRDCRGVDQARLVSLPGSVGDRIVPPSSVERASWAKARETQLDALVRLVESDRSDAGLALLLAWSRLLALEHSLQSEELYVLDSLAEGSREAGEERDAARVPAEWLALREKEASRQVESARRALGDTSHLLESRLFRLEWALHDLAHAREAESHRAPEASWESGGSLAARYVASRRVLAWSADVGPTALRERARAASRRASRLRRAVEADLGYSLFVRNCVTELLDALDEALASDAATRDFARARRKDYEAGLAFIPVVAGRIVERHAPVSGTHRLPSWREAELARLAERGASGWLALRESNALTSRTYRPHAADSTFLLFSQRPLWARPLAGVLNLATGIGATGVGILTAPFDHGRRFLSGVRGVTMSVPELFFFNIRKGSYPVAPPLGAD
jgi:hypothetical protein